MEFEVDCVRGLVNGVLSDYEEAETDRQLALTVASLVVGTATGVAASLWDLANSYTPEPAWNDGPVFTGIAGALGTTAIGAVVLVPPPQEIVYLHEHNVLLPIVQGDDPDAVFPTFVFRLIMAPGVDGLPSPHDDLIAAFDEMTDEAVGEGRAAKARAVVYGEGGIYDVRLLQLHQDLLEELGGTLDGLARDIDLLSSTIATLLSDERNSPP